jgi:alpha-ribazole phosphatase
MTTWWWVRHGPTHAKGLVGWTDRPADLGDTLAITRLHDFLPSKAVVVSSDLIRCIHTADALQGSRARLPHAPSIRELNFGDWEDRTFAEVSQTDPEISRAYWSTPGDIRPPNGESWNETGARVADFVDQMNKSHQGQNIIAVAHFGVILTQVQRASHISAKSALAFKIDNLSVTRIDFLDPHWRIHMVNHLP